MIVVLIGYLTSVVAIVVTVQKLLLHHLTVQQSDGLVLIHAHGSERSLFWIVIVHSAQRVAVQKMAIV
jgi:hypothetical protein